MNSQEHQLQVSCVRWFGYEYPKYRMLLYAIPNGGQRNYKVAVKLKREGVVAGVADLFLSIPNKKYHGLYIEMKYGSNKQTEKQKKFEKAVTMQGYKYTLVYSFDEFERVINDYIQEPETDV